MITESQCFMGNIHPQHFCLPLKVTAVMVKKVNNKETNSTF